MAADVVEGAQLVVAPADDKERLAVELGQEVRPGIRRLVDPARGRRVAAGVGRRDTDAGSM
jgi:hypothetical protein